MDLWGMDPAYLAKFQNATTIFKNKGIEVEAILFTPFSYGQARWNDVNADLTEVEQTAYDLTKPQVESTKYLVNDYELQNEVSLYPNIKADGSTGQYPANFDTPVGRLQAAVLKGMYRAVDDVRKESNLPLRIILGTTDRSFGFLTFVRGRGVFFDIVGYHIYPWEQHPSLTEDTWFGEGGPLGQLAQFDKPIHINEFNAGEIYSGTGDYASLTNYENESGKSMTEQGFRSLDKHLKEIINQSKAKVDAILFYEAWDEPEKAEPENRFGLYYDRSKLNQPKISLLLATCFAGGNLSAAELDSLTIRDIGQCTTNIIDDFTPATFHLNQNFPNPFNPTTMINYQLVINSDVRLEIYDVLGKKVSTLISSQQLAGNYSISWDATYYASGIYFYRLSAGNFVEKRKMLLIK